MNKTRTSQVAFTVLAICLLSTRIGNAQSCPSVGQIDGFNSTHPSGTPNNGLQNGAQVTIQVVGSTLQAGDSMISAAAQGWTTIQNATYTFTTQNVASVQSGNASASNPVIIFQVGPASDFAPGGICGGGAGATLMCSQPSYVDGAGHVVDGEIEFNPNYTTANVYFELAVAQEIGHNSFGIEDCDSCQTSATIMAVPATQTNYSGPTDCDQTYVYWDSQGTYGISSCSPPQGGCGNGYTWNQSQCACLSQEGQYCSPPPGGCGMYNTWVPYPTCTCQYAGSPIIVDTTGKGFHLTSAEDGVRFDIAGSGHLIQIAWTAADSGVAFLALDRNGNGVIDNGKELFGNFTEQSPSNDPNGFLALAEFDKPENGGNGDGVIDWRDAVWPKLRLWIDENHDGISQPNELHHLPSLGINSLALHYTESRRVDQFGNMFRYKGWVNPEGTPPGDHVDRIMYDVFFKIDTANAQNRQLERRIAKAEHKLD